MQAKMKECSIMQTPCPRLNAVQLHLLQMFSYTQTESSLKKMKDILFKYYCSEVERLGAQIAHDRALTDEQLEAMSLQHDRL